MCSSISSINLYLASFAFFFYNNLNKVSKKLMLAYTKHFFSQFIFKKRLNTNVRKLKGDEECKLMRAWFNVEVRGVKVKKAY